MKEISLIEVTEILQEKGIKAQFAHTGGGCGTLLIGEGDENGFFDYACGPAYYDNGMSFPVDLCFGKDGAEGPVTYFSDLDPLTPETVANAIIEMMKGWSK